MCKVNAKLKSNKIYEKKMETVLTRAKLYNLQEYRIDKKGEKKIATILSFGMSTFAKHIRRLTTVPW